ncbi:hypothetical protein KCU70_g4, partial [Aureobasidium melanogenum]
MRFSPVSFTFVLLSSLPSDQGGSIDDTYLGIAIVQIGTDLTPRLGGYLGRKYLMDKAYVCDNDITTLVAIVISRRSRCLEYEPDHEWEGRHMTTIRKGLHHESVRVNMRLQSLALICLCASFGLLIIGRRHIRDLFETGRTYSTYHALVRDHDDILYRYPSAKESDFNQSLTNDRRQEQAPRIIHQIFLTNGRNGSISNYLPAINACKHLHSSWDYKLWTEVNATAFMREHYPEIAPHYQGYRQSIQRANILRYALLHHYGVYSIFLSSLLAHTQPPHQEIFDGRCRT